MENCRKSPQLRRHPYEIIAFDWDGTAVADRRASARPVAEVLTELLRRQVKIVVITGTNFDNIDSQFSSLIDGKHKRNLFVCANRGSEVFGFSSRSRPRRLYGREASPEEDRLLDEVAEAVKRDIEASSSVKVDIVYDRLNRRKIDLIPEWPDPPKSRIGELIERTGQRLVSGGYGAGIRGAHDLAIRHAREMGLADARITSDVKHIEIGLTGKSDSVKWVIDHLAGPWHIRSRDMMFIGDEFGPVAGFAGSDYHMVSPGPTDITYVSVGPEPNGVPESILHAGGGPACFMELMRLQLKLREELGVTSDPAYVHVEEGFNPLREREIESLMAVSNGYLGVRGSLEEQHQASGPATLIAGIYDGGGESLEQMAVAPDWLFTRIEVMGMPLAMAADRLVEHRRLIDLKKGIYHRKWRHLGAEGRITSVSFMRFVSMDDPHALVMKIGITPENYSGPVRMTTGVKPCLDCRVTLAATGTRRAREGIMTLTAATGSGRVLSMSQAIRVHEEIEVHTSDRGGDDGIYHELHWEGEMAKTVTFEKYVSVFTSRESETTAGMAEQHVSGMASAGLVQLELDHVERWRERWEASAMHLEGDPEASLGINFSIYQLIGAGNPRDERVSISARALTGTIYQGHIFWDTEIFILPFFIFTWPAAARAALMYRYHTLPAARDNAAAAGYRGALFAWESAASGQETAPRVVLAPDGEMIEVTSGDLEDHIIADIAYGVSNYWNATGDIDFLLQAGAELMMETARFWVSRAREADGRYHLLGVEGPDEYHDQGVDDNYFTNAMASWNIRRALEIADFLRESHPGAWDGVSARIALEEAELDHWRQVGTAMYRGDSGSGNLIEQFRGYFQMEDVDLKDFEPRTAPLAVMLGYGRIARTQVLKQADVLMALLLLEEEVSEEAIRQNFEYYEPRTDHSSSLSPAIHGLLAARLGLIDKAMRYFQQSVEIDLANNLGNAAGGVHIAAMGGLWQQMILGFAGARPHRHGLYLFPRLPEQWPRLTFKLLWRGVQLQVTIDRDRHITVTPAGSGAVRVGIHGRGFSEMQPGKGYVSLWEMGSWNDFVEAGNTTASLIGSDAHE